MTDPPQEPPEYQISVRAVENARLCLRAALLRAEGRTYADIATELGLDSPDHARECADVGSSLGCEDVTSPRRCACTVEILGITYEEHHLNGCARCQAELAAPQPYREDLCRTFIGPDGDDVTRCPHPPAEGDQICEHHISWFKVAVLI